MICGRPLFIISNYLNEGGSGVTKKVLKEGGKGIDGVNFIFKLCGLSLEIFALYLYYVR